MTGTFPFNFKCRGLLLILLTLLIRRNSSTVAEAESIAALTAGVDEISRALSEHESSCSQTHLSPKLEEELSWIEGAIERQRDATEKVREKLLNASKKTEELLVHYYSVSPTSPPEACAEPFKIVAGSCFWAHKSPSLDWNDARKRCQQPGGDLATPDDIPAVIRFLTTELGLDWWYVWMGGKVIRSRMWRWLDTNVEVEIDSPYWYNNINNPGHCTAFNGGRGFKLMAWDCNDTSWYLCEKKI